MDHVASVARFGLPLPSGGRGPSTATVDAGTTLAEQRALLEQVQHERLTGLLVAAVDAGAVDLLPAVAEQLVEAHEWALSACLHLEALLVGVTARLDAAGIPSRVLKGSAFAHTVYDRPELRTFGDIDVLVRGADWDRAAELLVAEGCEFRYPEPRAGFTARYGKGRCLVTPTGHEIDLHRTFASGPFGLTVDPDALFAGGEPFVLAGHTLMALEPEHRLLHAAAHAVLGSRTPRLSALRDVAEMLTSGRIDLDRTRSVAHGWRFDAVLARAVCVADRTLALGGSLPLADWARTYVPTRFERRSLAVYVTEGRSYAAQAAAGLYALPRWRDKAAYAWALAHPDRAYLSGRDRAYRRRLMRALRAATGTGRDRTAGARDGHPHDETVPAASGARS